MLNISIEGILCDPNNKYAYTTSRRKPLLFLPAIIVLVIAKQDWLKTIAGLVLIVGFFASIEIWPLYLIALVIGYTVVASITWCIRKAGYALFGGTAQHTNTKNTITQPKPTYKFHTESKPEPNPRQQAAYKAAAGQKERIGK